MPIARYILLLVVTMGGGILSGIFRLIPNGLMAGAMAFCFSLGTIWLAEKERRRPGSVRLPDAIAAGFVSGLIAVIPVLLLEMLRPLPRGLHGDFLRSPDLDNWYLITAPILYGVTLHFSYYLRRAARKPLLKVLCWASLFAVQLQVLTLATQQGIDLVTSIPLAGIFLFFQAGLFTTLWVLLTWAVDRSGSEALNSDTENAPTQQETSP